LRVEVFVVDNNSVDGSVEMVARDFPDVTLIRNDENVGFARANNQAIRQARGKYLLILNPDTIVQEDTLRVLVDHLEAHPESGAVGCQILNPDGSFAPESRRAYPTPTVAFYRIVGLSKLFPSSPVFGRYNMTFLPRDEESEVDALSGSCMLVRHAALHVARPTWERLDQQERRCVDQGLMDDVPDITRDGAGLFDEDFFMYGEDLDWW
jgi:GT2 family glycosyltransferase